MQYQEKYILMLKNELELRKLANSRYSLRAFARDLEIDASRLSMIFSKKKGISFERASKIIKKLNWSECDKNLFLNFVGASHSRSKKKRDFFKNKLVTTLNELNNSKIKNVNDDLYSKIADPINYQIIEALKLKNIEKNVEGLTKIINYPRKDIELSVSTLLELGLITANKKELSVNEYVIQAGGKLPSQAVKNHHMIQLKLAKDSIWEQSISERCLSSLTLAIPQECIPDIYKKIETFRKEVNNYIMSKDTLNKSDVYTLTTQFFRVTKRRQNA